MINYDKLEQERVNALWCRDAVKYFQKCNELGLEPEVPELYKLGQAERMFNSKRGLEKSVKKPIKKIAKRKRIKGLDFFIPTYAYELRSWIKKYCETNKKLVPKGFSSMKKKQLYAIYFSLME